MDPEILHEFGVVENRIDRVEGRLASAVKLFLSIILPIVLAVGSTAVVVYAQVRENTSKNVEQSAQIEKLNGTRDKVIEIETRLGHIENDVKEVKNGQAEQRAILEKIQRAVEK